VAALAFLAFSPHEPAANRQWHKKLEELSGIAETPHHRAEQMLDGERIPIPHCQSTFPQNIRVGSETIHEGHQEHEETTSCPSWISRFCRRSKDKWAEPVATAGPGVDNGENGSKNGARDFFLDGGRQWR
jgi:hypothetical protein